MKSAEKHYKFINSKTGYAIFYHTLNSKTVIEQIKVELEKIRMQVATTNVIPLNTVYWEEIKEEGEKTPASV
ncbi:MAG: hypothetical protein ACXVAY_13790 [Mucilaginibacter sp.]